MHPYTSDLKHLGIYYKQYLRLMQHWRKVIDLPILEIRYENLVENQKKISRDLIAFAGLPWEENCLNFQENQRIVATASYDQVRQPIYQRSVNRWKHYRNFLDPLILELASLR